MEKRRKTILPIAPVDRLIRKANIERVSESAAISLAKILEEIGLEISKVAIELTKHANRKTVNEDDIKLAYKQLKRNFF
ncbi:MAG: histone [Candidatus Lokiarchaeota archaeon]|nr:histone [Candidatus Lokiarchaeota archaeon]